MKEKIIAEELYQATPEKFAIFRDWKRVDTKIREFENKSNIKTFIFLFGETEGLRLCKHFKYDCDSRFSKLTTYLLTEQYNDLLTNIFYNDELFII